MIDALAMRQQLRAVPASASYLDRPTAIDGTDRVLMGETGRWPQGPAGVLALPQLLLVLAGRGLADPVSNVAAVSHNESTRSDSTADRAIIADLVGTFFAAFTSGPGSVARLDTLRSAFLPGAVIVRTGGGEPVVCGVDTFINPRQALLSGGTLVDFSEWELRGHTEIFGDIAQHFGSYAKVGVQDGTPFTGRGMKTLQFVRTPDGWRISAAAWDDERYGLTIDTDWLTSPQAPP